MMKNVRMAHGEKLPWEMIEEILSRVPPKSLVCFITVSKKWNALFEDKTFLNSHKSTFRFVLATKSKIYSVSINPEIVVRELTLDTPGLESQTPKKLVDCNEFVLCGMNKGAVVWNPWLNQTRVIKSKPGLLFEGICCYDGNKLVKESGYKTIASYWKNADLISCWTIHDFATDVWKEEPELDSSASSDQQGRGYSYFVTKSGVSLNGKFYWVAYHDQTDPLYHLHVWDVWNERSFNIYHLPCSQNHPGDALVHGVFKGDRLSLLKQCHMTKKIEIWVTKNKINNDTNDVVWMTFMEVSISNLPDLVQIGFDTEPSYNFIDDKRLVVCCCDETGRAWIYVMGENKLIRKIKIEPVVDQWPLHCTHFPSLVRVPQGPSPREEA